LRHYSCRDVLAVYNVVQDPGETHDLASENPEKLAMLRQAWDRYAEDVGVVLAE